MLKQMTAARADKGGYSAFCTYSAGVTQLIRRPITSSAGVATRHLRWARSPSWRSCAMPGGRCGRRAQKKIGSEMQRQAFIDVPYVPLGVFYQPTAYKKELTGVLQRPACSGTCGAPDREPDEKTLMLQSPAMSTVGACPREEINFMIGVRGGDATAPASPGDLRRSQPQGPGYREISRLLGAGGRA